MPVNNKEEYLILLTHPKWNALFNTRQRLRWLKTVSSSYILMGYYNHSLSLDATTMISKNHPIIGENVITTFVTRQVTIATVWAAENTLYGLIIKKRTVNYFISF